MSEIEWVDSPPQAMVGVHSRGDGAWAGRLSPLMARPGAWARVWTSSRSSAGSTVTQLRSGRLTRPPGRWEFTSRKIDDKQGALYARYLGPDE